METTALTYPATNTAPGATEKKTTLNSDYETFLRMLTVQMKNQDPLNPVDSAEFSLQLATFSALEQQVLTNDLLKELTAGIGSNNLQGMAGILGSDVLVAEGAQFAGSPVTVYPRINPDADDARLVISDSDGTVVANQKLDPKIDRIEWTGAKDDGTLLPQGVYTFRTESLKRGAQIDTQNALTFATVNEARKKGDTVILVLDTGAEIDIGAIEGMRAPTN